MYECILKSSEIQNTHLSFRVVEDKTYYIGKQLLSVINMVYVHWI